MSQVDMLSAAHRIRLTLQQVEHHLGMGDLSPVEAKVVACIGQAQIEGYAISADSLAQRYGWVETSRINVFRAIDSLSRSGWVTRKLSRSDNRVKHLELCAANLVSD